MNKFIGCLIGIAVIIVLGVFIIFQILPGYAQSNLTTTLGVPVKIGPMMPGIGSVSIGPSSIENPEGSILEYALKVDHTNIEASPVTLLRDDIHIDELLLKDVYIGLELNSLQNPKGPWTDFMSKLSSKNKSATDTSKTVLIEEVILKNIQIDLVYRQGDRQVKKLAPIKEIRLHNISSEKGIPTEVIADIIMREAFRHIFSKEGLMDLMKFFTKPDGDDNVVDKIKEMFSRDIKPSRRKTIRFIA